MSSANSSGPLFVRRQILTSLIGLTGAGLLTGCAPGWDHKDSGIVIPPTFATGEAGRKEATLPMTAPTLFMVSARDCPNCATWFSASYPAFEQSDARARARFVIMNSFTIKQGSGADSIWPAEYRWIRDAATADKRTEYPPMTAWTPLWALVRGHDYILAAHGLKGWRDVMWPAIQRETGTT